MEHSTIESAARAENPLTKRDSEDLPRISRAQFWTVWGLAVVLFLFWTGPVWRHPWDIGLVNQAIFWSYLPIPMLVAACLLWSKRLTMRAFFLDTLELTLLKYSFTFALALVLWEAIPAPAMAQAAQPPPSGHHVADVEPAIVPTPIDPAMTGIIEGSVIDGAGLPVAGATVFVAAGLEAYVFAPPSEPVTLLNTGAGITPDLVVAQVGQTLLARSADGRLHTLVATKEGATLFNMPLLSSGEPSRARIREAAGLVTTRCNVHGRSDEHEGHLLVLDHPFFATSDAEGHIRLAGVPAGNLRVSAWREGQQSREAPVDIAPRGTSAIRLVMER